MKTRHSQALRVLPLSLLVLAMSAIAADPVAGNLRDAAQKAIVANPEVQAKWHNFKSVQEEQDVARGGYLPKLDLSAGAGREKVTTSNATNSSLSRRSTALTLNQMVFDGFATRSEVARLGYAKVASYYDLLDAAEQTTLETMRAYEDVLRYRELVALAQDNYVMHKQLFDQIQDRTKAGVGRRVDFEQASGRLALAESNLLTEASNLHDVSARYQRIVGELPAQKLATPNLLDKGLPPNIAEALKLAYAGHPAYNSAVEGIRQAQAEVEGRRSRFMPRVDVQARQENGKNLGGVLDRKTDQTVQVIMNYNLFNGGSDMAASRQYAERLNVAKDLRDKSCRDIRQTLEIAYNDVARLKEQLTYLEQHQLSIAKAREAYRKQFDIGQRTLLDLLDTENEYFQARRAYANAQYDYALAYGRSLAGMGRLMQTLQVSRENMPSLAELTKDSSPVDPTTACPAEAPSMPVIDKAALLAAAAPLPIEQPAAPVAAADPAGFTDRLRNWAKAWESKNLPDYQSYYAKNFEPTPGQTTGGKDVEAWKKARAKYLSKSGPIKVELSGVAVSNLTDQSATTEFVQAYTSDGYTDTVRKRLDWVKESGVWRIKREIVRGK